MISVVCVFNNMPIFSDYLLKSLKNQTAAYELISVDNRSGRFKSCAEALNYGGGLATGRYIMFAHQDVDLSDKNCLGKIEALLDAVENPGAAGVAGKSGAITGVASNIAHGLTPSLAGRASVAKPLPVQTLDECVIVVPKSVFDRHRFDEITCDGWHLYAVDYCLNLLLNNYNVYVLPVSLYHRSNTYSFSYDYFYTIRKLFGKYAGRYPYIYTTCGDWNTSLPVVLNKPYLSYLAGCASERWTGVKKKLSGKFSALPGILL